MPSLKYDALCLLNSMSGDPYYLRYYEAEYDHFHLSSLRRAGCFSDVEAHH